jgi:hypothetical protein
MTVLYAVIPVDVAPPTRLDVLEGNKVAVIHSKRESATASRRDAVLAFGRIVLEIAGRGPTLPMRFGTTVANLAECRRVIAEREDGWSSRLRAIAGCCELIVHLGHPGHTGRVPAWARLTPREERLRRAEAAAGRDELYDELRASLLPWSREVRLLTGKRSDRMALLVPRDATVPTQIRLRRWAAERPDLSLTVTGPAPPFSFCEEPA